MTAVKLLLTTDSRLNNSHKSTIFNPHPLLNSTMADAVIAILENATKEPLPAALVAVGGLCVLKFALGVSACVRRVWFIGAGEMHFMHRLLYSLL